MKWTFYLLAGLALTRSEVLQAQPPAQRFNVLFISVDDLNTDIGSYGHPLVKTPNIDRLAKQGTVFTRAYCQYPLCNPSRASVMTGLNPAKTKVYDLSTHFRAEVPTVITLPQLFLRQSYFTARVGKIYHYGVPGGIGKNGLDDSVSWLERINPIGRDVNDQPSLTRLLPRGVGLGANLTYLEAEGADEEQTDGKVATQAIRLLKENKDKPFFIAAGFYRPHLPFIAPKKYFDLYPVEKIRLPPMPANKLDDIPDAALFTRPANWNLSPNDQKLAIRGYYASISFMDAQVGRLLDAVEELGLSNNTIIVLWSDHGYNLGEHGQWQKRSLFEKSVRIPLIISVPGGKASQSSERTVELIDLYPTIATLCGLALPAGLDGADLSPLLADPGASWNRPAFSQISLGDTARNVITRLLPGFDSLFLSMKTEALTVMGRSIRTERWRYTEWDHGRLGLELYDELNDPDELVNLAADERYQAERHGLAALLAARFKE